MHCKKKEERIYEIRRLLEECTGYYASYKNYVEKYVIDVIKALRNPETHSDSFASLKTNDANEILGMNESKPISEMTEVIDIEI